MTVTRRTLHKKLKRTNKSPVNNNNPSSGALKNSTYINSDKKDKGVAFADGTKHGVAVVSEDEHTSSASDYFSVGSYEELATLDSRTLDSRTYDSRLTYDSDEASYNTMYSKSMQSEVEGECVKIQLNC